MKALLQAVPSGQVPVPPEKRFLITISIITVCRNEEANIRRTCESVCSQTVADSEWIVIDGASTDGTLDILSEYKDRIGVMVSEPDRGIYDAMNKGVARASGRYLIFLNGGDRFADNDVLKTAAGASGAGILYGDLIFERPDGSRELKRFPDALSRRWLLKHMMPHQSSFIKRELFERYGNYDTSFRIAGDYDLFVRLLHVEKVSALHLPEPIAVFNGDGVSSNPEFRALRKMENHRVRKTYFPAYRWSLKAWRQELRNLSRR